VLPDGIGHGKSSKPSDGLRMKFPKYTYDDMVDAEHRLLVEGLKVNHLRLAMGTSMGCMHAWVWGERYPDFVDGRNPEPRRSARPAAGRWAGPVEAEKRGPTLTRCARGAEGTEALHHVGKGLHHIQEAVPVQIIEYGGMAEGLFQPLEHHLESDGPAVAASNLTVCSQLLLHTRMVKLQKLLPVHPQLPPGVVRRCRHSQRVGGTIAVEGIVYVKDDCLPHDNRPFPATVFQMASLL
jgi:pimeloyl-ACP methyl ester carboxylesterase